MHIQAILTGCSRILKMGKCIIMGGDVLRELEVRNGGYDYNTLYIQMKEREGEKGSLICQLQTPTWDTSCHAVSGVPVYDEETQRHHYDLQVCGGEMGERKKGTVCAL